MRTLLEVTSNNKQYINKAILAIADYHDIDDELRNQVHFFII